MITDILIIWALAAIIAGVLSTYWVNGACAGEFGPEAQATLQDDLRKFHQAGFHTTKRFFIIGYIAIGVVIPFVMIPVALYAYIKRAVTKRLNPDRQP